MADEKVQTGPASYGYETDEQGGKGNPFVFGLNTGAIFLKEFKFIPNGGKDGVAQEALEIIFDINGTEKSARMFPITKAFGKNNEEITDPNSKEMKDAMVNFNAMIVHILHAFQPDDVVKAGLSVPFDSFKSFIDTAASILPKNFTEIPLDIFFHWGWQIGTKADKTYLELPKKMNTGKWVIAAQPGTWTEKRFEEKLTEKTPEAIWWENEKGEKHPFIRNGWFALSNFAAQQKEGGSTGRPDSVVNNNPAATTAIQTNEQKAASGW